VQLRATAGDLTHSAEATNLKSMAAAAASRDASSNVQVAAGVANHLSQAIGEISQRVHKSNRIAGKAADEADRTHAEVRNLSEATERIDGIIDLISNIAGQTNMLALNAAIEAARAGEAGRGFAVVAQEVKNLAEATAKATAEIGAQVVGIQTTTQNVASFIATIAETTREVSSIAVSVETAIAEQEIETREIACRVEEAARGTAEVASNIAGMTQAAGHSSSAARKLLESATNLTQQSEVLANHVENFLKRVRTA
jgi:methyl-accepting chemotaxis protein